MACATSYERWQKSAFLVYPIVSNWNIKYSLVDTTLSYYFIMSPKSLLEGKYKNEDKVQYECKPHIQMNIMITLSHVSKVSLFAISFVYIIDSMMLYLLTQFQKSVCLLYKLVYIKKLITRYSFSSILDGSCFFIFFFSFSFPENKHEHSITYTCVLELPHLASWWYCAICWSKNS